MRVGEPRGDGTLSGRPTAASEGAPIPQEGKPGLQTKPSVRTSLRLSFSLPRGKVASLMGVMNFLQSRFRWMEVTVAAADGQLMEQGCS
jgi:hypothetical protein